MPIPSEIQNELDKQTDHLVEVRRKLDMMPQAGDIKAAEDRIINDMLPTILKAQEAELEKRMVEKHKAQLDGLQAQLDEQRAIAQRTGAAGDPAIEQRAAQHRAAFVDVLKHGGNAEMSRAYQDFIQSERDIAGAEARTLSISTFSDGGALVPDGARTQMQTIFTQIDPVEALSQRLTLAPGADTYLTPKMTTDIESQDPATEVSEMGTGTAAQPAFQLVRRAVHPITVLTPSISADLLNQVTNFEDILSSWAGRALGFRRNKRFLLGTGPEQPQGLLTAVSGTDITTDVDALDTGGHEISAEDFISLMTALKDPYSANGVFMMKRATLGKAMKLRTEDGGAGTGTFLLPVSARDGFPSTIFGVPYYTAENMQASGVDNNYAVLFGDFNYYFTATDGAVALYRDPYSVMPNTRLLWRVRYDGSIANKEAFVRLKM